MVIKGIRKKRSITSRASRARRARRSHQRGGVRKGTLKKKMTASPGNFIQKIGQRIVEWFRGSITFQFPNQFPSDDEYLHTLHHYKKFLEERDSTQPLTHQELLSLYEPDETNQVDPVFGKVVSTRYSLKPYVHARAYYYIRTRQKCGESNLPAPQRRVEYGERHEE